MDHLWKEWLQRITNGTAFRDPVVTVHPGTKPMDQFQEVLEDSGNDPRIAAVRIRDGLLRRKNRENQK